MLGVILILFAGLPFAKPASAANANDISSAHITIEKQTFTGAPIEPKLVVEIKKTGAKLVLGTDYTAEFSNNINAGKATVKITGIGNYTGTKTDTFVINKADISKAKVTGIANKVYIGKAITQTPVIKFTSAALSTKDYTISYKNNVDVGTATITISGQNNCQGTLTKTFKINPKKTSIVSLTRGKRLMTVKWKKVTKQTTGYQICYALNKKFTKGKKTITIAKNTTVSKKIKKLKSSKVYYVKVRTYKVVGTAKFYSKWSKVKSVKVK